MSLSYIKRSTSIAQAQENPIALSEMRWNIIKLSREWDTRITSAMALHNQEKAELIKSQKRALAKHKKHERSQMEKAKATVPMNKRLEQMRRSYENLKFAGQEQRAKQLKKRLDPMMDGFYRKELSSHITKARLASQRLKGELQSKRAALDVTFQTDLSRLKAEKDRDLKTLKRSNPRSSSNPFALHYAASTGEMDRIEVMLARPHVREDIDVRDKDSGWTPLHFAARSGHVAVCEALLKHGAKVNALGPKDETPLHLAAGWGTKAVVGLLLQSGADKAMETEGRTPYDIAKANLRTDISNFIDRWLPVGLGFAAMQDLSRPPPPAYEDEPSKEIARQLRTLDNKMRVQGRNHIGVVHSYNKLAAMYKAEGRWDEAIDASKRVVEVRQLDLQSSPSPERQVDVGSAMNNLAGLCHDAGYMDEARRYFKGALDMVESTYGPDDARCMPAVLNYGSHLLDVAD